VNIIEKYDLGKDVALLTSDPGHVLSAIHAVIVNLVAEVDAIELAEKNAPKVDAPNPLAERFGKDEEGAKAAEAFLRTKGGVFDLVTDYIGNDPGRTFHVKNAVSELLGKYLSNEVSFFAAKDAPKTAKVSRKGEFKADVNDLRKQIAFVAGFVTGAGFDGSSLPEILTFDGKVWTSAVPGYKGAKSMDGEDNPVTGRYAKVYGLSWKIDGEDIPKGPIADITRRIWTGADRIGKNAKSLTDILDKRTKWMDTDFTSANFTENGHKVTVYRTVSE
jgi:hypothetical protein